MARAPSGFTLIEIAMGLFILALLLASLLSPIAAQIEQKKISETQNALNQINEALMGFAMSKGYLPCPDKTSGGVTPPNDTGPNDGKEDFSAAGTCVALEGNLPWVTLGIAPGDAWGRVYHYRITTAFGSRSPAALFKLDSVGTLTICSSAAVAGACPAGATTFTTSAPAVVLSYGKNGYGGIVNATFATMPAPAPCPGNPCTSADELENFNGDAFFVSRTLTGVGAPAGEFDDIVSWLSTPVLMSRMVSAQKLP